MVAGGQPAAADIASVMTTHAGTVGSARLVRAGESSFRLDWPAPHTVGELGGIVAASAVHLLLLAGRAEGTPDPGVRALARAPLVWARRRGGDSRP